MKVRDLRRLKWPLKYRKGHEKLIRIPILGSIGENFEVLEKRRRIYAAQEYIRSVPLCRGFVTWALDDALAPELPAKAVLACDGMVKTYQSDGYYITSALPQHDKGQGGCAIAKITRQTDGSFDYMYAKDDIVRLENLNQLEIKGRIEAIVISTDQALRPKLHKV